MVVRVEVSKMLINPLDVPVMIWAPLVEKMAEVVACRASVLESGVSVKGVLERRCVVAMGWEASTRKGGASNSETTKRKWL